MWLAGAMEPALESRRLLDELGSMAAQEEKIATELKKKGEVSEDCSEQFSDVKMATILSGETNPRGIPFVAFIESVRRLQRLAARLRRLRVGRPCRSSPVSPRRRTGPSRRSSAPSTSCTRSAAPAPCPRPVALSRADRRRPARSRFKILEGHKARTKVSMKQKIPEISKTLQLVEHLKTKHEAAEDFQSHYSLSEMIYGRATITPSGNVCLWLGANVMVEYPYDEAIAILSLSLKNAKLRLEICDEDLDTLRDQIITVEVNMARVFNYDVKRRREEGKSQPVAA